MMDEGEERGEMLLNEQVEVLLQAARELRASDMHLTVGQPPIMRIHGDLRHYGRDVVNAPSSLEMARSMMTETHWETFRKNGELDFSCGLPNGVRFRVNAFYQRSTVSLAIRVIPTIIPSLEDLCMPEVLKKIASKPQGLVVVTGPTGSGKSTTLASMIDYINQHMCKHIITLEDPIEYLHQHRKSVVNQREIGFDTQTFASGLRASLRQDPDVILVGEMRDLETISTAITAAETGHLVLATLHTSNAPSTIDRIIDVFPASQQPQVRLQLASVLLAVISQRLFPTIDRQGRQVGTEILINNTAVANLIRNEKTHQLVNVMQTSKAQGMHTLDMSINELLTRQVISKESAEPYIKEKG